MEKTDFKKLDVERAQIAVAVQEARDLVAKMLGSGFDNAEEEKPVIAASSSVVGLGYKIDTSAQVSQGKALEKLKTAHKKSIARSNVQPVSKQESDSEEEESRTSSVRTQKRGMTALDAYRNKRNKRKKA